MIASPADWLWLAAGLVGTDRGPPNGECSTYPKSKRNDALNPARPAFPGGELPAIKHPPAALCQGCLGQCASPHESALAPVKDPEQVTLVLQRGLNAGNEGRTAILDVVE